MSGKIEVRLDQEYVLVVQDGRTLSPGARVTMTAAELAVMVRDYVAAERQAGSARIQAAAQAGVQAGADYALQHTRKRRTIERNPGGQIVALVDSREPLPSPPKPAEKPAREPMGFRPR